MDTLERAVRLHVYRRLVGDCDLESRNVPSFETAVAAQLSQNFSSAPPPPLPSNPGLPNRAAYTRWAISWQRRNIAYFFAAASLHTTNFPDSSYLPSNAVTHLIHVRSFLNAGLSPPRRQKLTRMWKLLPRSTTRPS